MKLHQPDSRGTYRYELNGLETHHEAFLLEGHVIWGLTYRILRGFLQVIA
jgi:hypothetical protein